jgi:DNA replication protein
MVTSALDFKFLLLENYKKLKISEQELATILMIDHLSNQGNYLITADLLSLKMSLKTKEIDTILADLFTRGFIEFTSKGKKTMTSLDPLKTILYREFHVTLEFEEVNNHDEKMKGELKNIYAQFEELLARSLSPVEIAKIREWISIGYDDNTIIDALKEALSKGKRTIKSVDKILLSWSARNDVETEGRTAIDERWDKNLEETIRIAKTPWVKK